MESPPSSVSAIDQARKNQASVYVLLVLPWIPAALEGTGWEVDRTHQVHVETVLAASPEQVRQAMAKPPSLSHDLPAFLQMGFPRPVDASGSGLEPGDERRIRFAGGEGEPGDMVFRVAESGPDYVEFQLVRDDSHIAHWLSWDASRVRWEPTAHGRTRVTWEVRFTRHLDPFWWFEPWERYAIAEASTYLLESLRASTQL